MHRHRLLTMPKSQISIAAGIVVFAIIGYYPTGAAAQQVSLYCQNEHPANNMLVDVDYGTNRVTWGSAARHSPPMSTMARVSQFDISWQGVGSARDIAYRIDRTTGVLKACGKEGCWPDSTCQPAQAVERKF
jgi:hypothetical protein